jgi:hypothetical protein
MDVKRVIRDRQLLVELFVVANCAGLVGDIFLAHSQNHFRREAEYIPLVFSIAATAVLVGGLACPQRAPEVWPDPGHLVGWLAIAVGGRARACADCVREDPEWRSADGTASLRESVDSGRYRARREADAEPLTAKGRIGVVKAGSRPASMPGTWPGYDTGPR